tara:strand:+ start:497 stop:895 length:399 start_codon:yes stop_codon:yes gene_type:complete
MSNLEKYYRSGAANSLLFKDNGKLSHNGPWAPVNTNTVIDRLFLGDFFAAEYTIAVDLDNLNKEIIKCTLVATTNDANLVVYSRNSTLTKLVELSARVNDSYAELLISPATPKAEGAKYIYTAQLFQTQNPL